MSHACYHTFQNLFVPTVFYCTSFHKKSQDLLYKALGCGKTIRENDPTAKYGILLSNPKGAPL